MSRCAAVVLFAALLLPAAAGAQAVAIDTQATGRAIGNDDLALCKELWKAALERAGLATAVVEGKRQAAPQAEFVASLAVDRDGEAVVFTGLASRVRLDRWAFRHEARAPFADRAAWTPILDLVAENLAGALRAAPPRTSMQPPPRARVKLKHAIAPRGAPAPAAAPAEAPAAEAGDEVPAEPLADETDAG